MKKRFTKQTIRQYLLGKLPENLLPGRVLKQAERRYLLRSQSLSGRPRDNRNESLLAIVGKEMERVGQIGASSVYQSKIGKRRWSELDTLEQGPRGNNPCLNTNRGLFPREIETIETTVSQVRNSVDSLTSALHIKGAATGQHRGRSSPLLQQITERRKIRILYGNLSNKQVDTLMQTAIAMRGERSQNIFKLLESRLDVVLYRGNMFPSITIAQQWIRRGSITINERVETVAARMLTPGDVIKPAPHLLPILSKHLRNYWRNSTEWPPFEGEKGVAEKKASYQTRDDIETNGVKGGGDITAPKSHSIYSKKWSGFVNRPLHIEVSFRTLSIVYLSHAQDIILPALVDMAQVQMAYSK